jgi:hypothetical protein
MGSRLPQPTLGQKCERFILTSGKKRGLSIIIRAIKYGEYERNDKLYSTLGYDKLCVLDFIWKS